MALYRDRLLESACSMATKRAGAPPRDKTPLAGSTFLSTVQMVPVPIGELKDVRPLAFEAVVGGGGPLTDVARSGPFELISGV